MTQWIRRHGLDSWVGILLDKNVVQRSSILMFLIFIETLQFSLWAVMAYYWPYAHHFINPSVIERGMPYGVAIVLMSLALLILCRACAQHPSHWIGQTLQYIIAIFYMIEMTFFGYFIGSMSIASGVVLMGAPIFGLFMLERRPVYVALLSGTALMLLLSYATVREWIVYAPLLKGDQRLELANADFWYWSLVYFTLPHIIIVLGFCDLLMTSLRRREAEVRYLSERDALTGLLNRRSLHRLMQEMYQHPKPESQYLGLMILDLDHFKRINDQHGHLIGDEVLRLTAEVLQNTIRKQDLAGRFGGEEFVVVLENATEQEVMRVAQRIREQLQAITLYDQIGQRVQVSGSFGAISLSLGRHIQIEQAIHLVDQALYQAKQQGRNQVVMARS